MPHSHPQPPSAKGVSQKSAVGGPLPALRALLDTEASNEKRGWRLSAGFLFQALVVAVLFGLPVLFTERLDSTSPVDRAELFFPVFEGLASETGGGDGPPEGAGGTVPEGGPRVPALSETPLWATGSEQPGGEFPNPSPTAYLGPGEALGGEAGSGAGQPGWRTETPGPPAPREPVRPDGGRVKQPRLVHRVEPAYPPPARVARIEGDVIIEAVIGIDGGVRRLTVKQGNPALIRAAVEAVEQWLYEPTLLNDQPVPVLLEVVVEFRLRSWAAH